MERQAIATATFESCILRKIAKFVHRKHTLLTAKLCTLELAPGGLFIISDFCVGAYSIGGGLKIFLAVGHIPVEIFLLISYFLDAKHTGNSIFFKTGEFSLINGWFFFPSSIQN